MLPNHGHDLLLVGCCLLPAAGIPCSAACNCKGCKNCVPGGRRMQALQAVVRAPVGSRSQQRLSSEGSPLESSQLQSDAAGEAFVSAVKWVGEVK